MCYFLHYTDLHVQSCACTGVYKWYCIKQAARDGIEFEVTKEYMFYTPPQKKNIIKKQKKTTNNNKQINQRNKQTIKTLTTSSFQINSARVRGAKYCEQGLFTNIAFSFILLSQWSKSVLGSAAWDNMESSVLTKVFTGLRRLFYAVSPSETSFPTVDEVPKYVDEVSCVIIFSFI